MDALVLSVLRGDARPMQLLAPVFLLSLRIATVLAMTPVLYAMPMPVRVSDGNVVLSTRLADAKISYVGDGDIAERNRKPWWRNLLDAMGL